MPRRERKPQPKRAVGRPKGQGFHPTDEQRQTVRLAAAYKIPEDEIVLAIINPATKKPISPVTLRKHFPEELQQGFVNGKMRLMAATFQSATGVKDASGGYALNPNVTAQIWLGKVLYGFREVMSVAPGSGNELPPGVQADSEEVTLEAARRVAFTMALGASMVRGKKPA